VGEKWRAVRKLHFKLSRAFKVIKVILNGVGTNPERDADVRYNNVELFSETYNL